MRISIDSCCCFCLITETPLAIFFAKASIESIPLNLLDKYIGTHRLFHPHITGYNKYRYLFHQLLDRPTGESNRLCTGLYAFWSKQQISIDNFRIPIGQTVGIDRQFRVAIGDSTRCRSTMWHTYCKNNGILCRSIRTYWSKKEVSIDRFTHLSQEQKPVARSSLDVLIQAIVIDRQIRVPIEGVNRHRYEIPQTYWHTNRHIQEAIVRGVVGRPLRRICHALVSYEWSLVLRYSGTRVMRNRYTTVPACFWALE